MVVMRGEIAGNSKPMVDRELLDRLYSTFNRREYVHPDPLEFLYDYPDPLDREIVGLIASSLAYGSVMQILRSVSSVLERIPEPRKFLLRASRGTLLSTFADFKYRFTTGEELAALLYGIGRVVKKHDSLQECFLSGMSEADEDILPGLSFLVNEISSEAGSDFYHLLPNPSRKSACKRLNLFMRWMVREDDVDPGGWYTVPSDRLIVPIDVHMFRICSSLGLTCRKQADLRTAVEITESFRNISPEDPVKYDFAITRLGIRDELDPAGFIADCRDKFTTRRI
jgi:uncharacterized protein (TIGR02757 family)